VIVADIPFGRRPVRANSSKVWHISRKATLHRSICGVITYMTKKAPSARDVVCSRCERMWKKEHDAVASSE
jgi:hypothetical protein